MANRTLGTDPETADVEDVPERHRHFEVVPGPVGVTPMKAGDRIVTEVKKDWDPLVLVTTPEIVVTGKTLEEVADSLNARGEWGEGGGGIPKGPVVPVGTSAEVQIELNGKFVRILPRWREYPQASAAAKREWDRMMVALTAHEDRHVEIAVEECDSLASELVGKEIGQIARLINASGKRIRERQKELDTSTDHGAKAGVKYGDVSLDTSIV